MILRHVVVTDRSRVAVVPIYGDPAPRLSFDGALIGRVAVPADTVSNNEPSRFFSRGFGVPQRQPSRIRYYRDFCSGSNVNKSRSLERNEYTEAVRSPPV
jgi:hypothetical protein